MSTPSPTPHPALLQLHQRAQKHDAQRRQQEVAGHQRTLRHARFSLLLMAVVAVLLVAMTTSNLVLLLGAWRSLPMVCTLLSLLLLGASIAQAQTLQSRAQERLRELGEPDRAGEPGDAVVSVERE
jgi:hypothetical protein